jgi:hypothetical protein
MEPGQGWQANIQKYYLWSKGLNEREDLLTDVSFANHFDIFHLRKD